MQNILNKLSQQFLCGLAFSECSFAHVNWDLDNQETLLNTTINSDLVLKYPLKIEYQKAFLKFLLNQLEEQGLEIHEDLYSAYARLVAVPESTAEYYKHYPIGNRSVISLTENVNLISEGTTGLRTWQASLALAEWCLENKNSLVRKNILELGSGIGLTGLVASLECQPNKFYFSDCHPSVLKTLCENIELNSKNTFTVGGSVVSSLWNRFVLNKQLQSGVNIRVLNLPWEDVDSAFCDSLGKIDLILAADIVYDSSVFKPLIEALRYLAEKSQVENIVFACTERNLETLETFLQEIGHHFKVTEEDCPSQNNFIWSASPPVRIFRFKLL